MAKVGFEDFRAAVKRRFEGLEYLDLIEVSETKPSEGISPVEIPDVWPDLERYRSEGQWRFPGTYGEMVDLLGGQEPARTYSFQSGGVHYTALELAGEEPYLLILPGVHSEVNHPV